MANQRYRTSFAAMGREARENLVLALKDLGQDAINHAYKTGFMSKLNPPKKNGEQSVVWKHETGNLHDSIGSAVYVNGELREDTICYVGGAANYSFGKKSSDGIDSRDGRTVLLDYLRSIHPQRGKEEITLVCVAAMYYTKFLESGAYAWNVEGGGSKSKWKIRVISGALDYVKANKEEYTSRVYKNLGIKFPKTKVVRGDIRPLKLTSYYD